MDRRSDAYNQLRRSGRGELAGGASSLIWLVFLLIPLGELLSDRRANVAHVVVAVAAVAVFAALFCALVLLPEERRNSVSRPVLLAIVAAMWGLTIFLVFYDRSPGTTSSSSASSRPSASSDAVG